MKKIAIFCGTFYFAPKALKQSIWSILVARNNTEKLQMLCLRALEAK